MYYSVILGKKSYEYYLTQLQIQWSISNNLCVQRWSLMNERKTEIHSPSKYKFRPNSVTHADTELDHKKLF